MSQIPEQENKAAQYKQQSELSVLKKIINHKNLNALLRWCRQNDSLIKGFPLGFHMIRELLKIQAMEKSCGQENKCWAKEKEKLEKLIEVYIKTRPQSMYEICHQWPIEYDLIGALMMLEKKALLKRIYENQKESIELFLSQPAGEKWFAKSLMCGLLSQSTNMVEQMIEWGMHGLPESAVINDRLTDANIDDLIGKVRPDGSENWEVLIKHPKGLKLDIKRFEQWSHLCVYHLYLEGLRPLSKFKVWDEENNLISEKQKEKILRGHQSSLLSALDHAWDKKMVAEQVILWENHFGFKLKKAWLERALNKLEKKPLNSDEKYLKEVLESVLAYKQLKKSVEASQPDELKQEGVKKGLSL